ncbi:hypothetical protein QFZ28_002639 [Neobacillus niacini]|uniref:hypothetical protein n=1 Tax=Neobacillus niacini TaxID=86668 RepID=UPI0027822814|nr:hypothetical protein [Neobacillus niacini]MDQ1002239.1 hypothetical protein [Neobacillus niacini]
MFDIIKRSTGYSKSIDFIRGNKIDQGLNRLLEGNLFKKDKQIIIELANELDVPLMIEKKEIK